MHRYVALSVFLACLSLCASFNSDLLSAEKAKEYNVKTKKECVDEKEDCIAAVDTFKCAMMFVNLTKLEPKIIEIIPDVLGQDPPPPEDVLEELEEKEIKFEAFKIDDLCPAAGASASDKINGLKNAKRRANARCFAFLQSYTKEALDSCDSKFTSNTGEEADEQTAGDAMCEKAYEAYNFQTEPKFWFVPLVEMGVYTSYCGSPWQQVKSGGKHLTIKQKLCCIKDRKTGEIKYRPCNGSKNFKKSCKA